MGLGKVRVGRLWALGMAGLFVACTDASLQVPSAKLTSTDDHLTVQGTVCTHAPDPSGFPVKVIFIIDQSGSMCISDPPGAQANNGFCEQVNNLSIFPVAPGSKPARILAAEQLARQFSSSPADIEVAVVPFETNIQPPWPATGGFAKPTGDLTSYLDNLQSQLGEGTDYQGVLNHVYSLIASDITKTAQNNPALLPRTRYVMVFLTDGSPFPRCAAPGDPGPFASVVPFQPWGTWPDSANTGEFCNLTTPPAKGGITGFVGGTDRNQNYQLFTIVDQIMSLKQQYNVGDIRLHTVLLLNVAAVNACTQAIPTCQDLYWDPPVIVNNADAEKVSSWMLAEMARRGNGVFQEFKDGQIQKLALGALDYTSFAAPNAMKTLILQDLTSAPVNGQRLVDSDGDGLDDNRDNAFTLKTSPFLADTDGDCFDDNFEALHAKDGFDAVKRDLRGCNPASPLTPNCTCRDTDGDGLDDRFAETYLGTNSNLVDSDADGIPDGLEVRYGLDPNRSNVGVDTDGDGIEDLEEIRAGTNPGQQDRDLHNAEGYQYTTTARPQPNGSICYDFTIANVRMHTPPSHAGQLEGFNLFKLWFAEAPESGVATDYGVWRTACLWAQYAPPGVRTPVGPSAQMVDGNFVDPSVLAQPGAYLTHCAGVAP